MCALGRSVNRNKHRLLHNLSEGEGCLCLLSVLAKNVPFLSRVFNSVPCNAKFRVLYTIENTKIREKFVKSVNGNEYRLFNA